MEQTRAIILRQGVSLRSKKIGVFTPPPPPPIAVNYLTGEAIQSSFFFISPKNGGALICDNDNVYEFGKNGGVAGKARYMAPEIVKGANSDKQSDNQNQRRSQ
jgi:hypothetical protein